MFAAINALPRPSNKRFFVANVRRHKRGGSKTQRSEISKQIFQAL